MTGINNPNPNPNQNQTPTFLTTLQATLDILDDVSGAMPENTYLTLTNNLQELYNMHTSNPTSNANPPSNSTSHANPPITIPINYISDISYASISNFDISNANNTINNINNNNINNINNNYNENIQSRIQSLNEETNRMNYSTRTRLVLYNNVFNT